MIKVKNRHILSIAMWVIYMDGQCHKSCLLNVFKLIENTTQFNVGFIKSYNEDSDEGCFLEVDVQYPENLCNLQNELPFLLERIKLKKSKNL